MGRRVDVELCCSSLLSAICISHGPPVARHQHSACCLYAVANIFCCRIPAVVVPWSYPAATLPTGPITSISQLQVCSEGSAALVHDNKSMICSHTWHTMRFWHARHRALALTLLCFTEARCCVCLQAQLHAVVQQLDLRPSICKRSAEEAFMQQVREHHNKRTTKRHRSATCDH